ncbi:tRNA pseudouridine(55) synthase TruB [Anaerobutyricum hallii]|nr:tRNA pseudouridine(55) synthase TruB [Anaerobutyricum hallii]
MVRKKKSGKDGKQYSSYTVGNRFRVYDNQKNFIGIYQLQEKKMLKPYKLFL